ncbi:unnamed protein product [Acanthoscelides obtectus]|uniref:Uncharacterized protein n=1 Tax=Acanthoscelides obtectus TaxID=200917 RepID=A0A9P0KNU0_ACAOB|nr:unnamed protein product [Acanthoscelides obtectus]CAK1655779.1 hypothetical protein AOBTE_LOCUS19328 [Acanthoscelides obtectus]
MRPAEGKTARMGPTSLLLMLLALVAVAAADPQHDAFDSGKDDCGCVPR